MRLIHSRTCGCAHNQEKYYSTSMRLVILIPIWRYYCASNIIHKTSFESSKKSEISLEQLTVAFGTQEKNWIENILCGYSHETDKKPCKKIKNKRRQLFNMLLVVSYKWLYSVSWILISEYFWRKSKSVSHYSYPIMHCDFLFYLLGNGFKNLFLSFNMI